MTIRTDVTSSPGERLPAPGGKPAHPVPALSRLAAGAAALAAVAAALGLLLDGVYNANRATTEMLRGFDAVTLAVAAALALAIPFAHRRSITARLLVPALLSYLIYTYAYHLFGTGLNDLMLLHVAVFAVSIAGLVVFFASTRPDDLLADARFGAPARATAVLLQLLATALGALWIYTLIVNVITGELPAGSALVETPSVVHLGIALDLTLLVPLYGTAAVLLWRRTAGGLVLATIAVVAGLLHQVSYVVALVFQDLAGVPGAVPFDPGEPVIVLVYGLATVLVLRSLPPRVAHH